MNFVLEYVPFSRRGSFFAFSKNTENSKVVIRNVEFAMSSRNIFDVELTYDGQVIPYAVQASPESLKLIADPGFVEFIISDAKTLRFRGTGVGVRLSVKTTDYDFAASFDEKKVLLTYATGNTKFMMIPLQNTAMTVGAPWEVSRCTGIVFDFLPGKNRVVEGVIDNFSTEWVEKDFSKTSFEQNKSGVLLDYQNWFAKSTAGCCPDYPDGCELASYITWSCMVPPLGNLTRNAMYMSKNWMASIWSWDNCFNALGLATTFPELALEQFLIFFDHQNDFGAFPDYINDVECIWSFNKPPIQGLFLNEILKKTKDRVLDEKMLGELYEPLCRWTNWWFTYNDYNHNGIPQYKHGNDCGWDNSTVFHNGVPVESPDLLSFLVLQLEFLSLVAERLGKEEESQRHYKAAQEKLDLLIENFWTEEGFVARHNDGSVCSAGDSLLLFMPIILGKRLPDHIREHLISGLKEEGRFLTEYGFATESVKSPYYKANGYWRGPIWAPSTFLIVRGLEACGEMDFAREIKKRFCTLCNHSGMAENFNALTGEGLCDRAFTWTSSVFLVFARELSE